VSRAFTGRRVALLEDHIRDVCAGLLDAQVGSGRFDYVQDFSAILPPTIISALVGVPESDRERLRHLVDAEVEDEQGKARRLSDDELMDFGLLLFSAGTETVARHLGWVAGLLDEYPDQRAELAKDFSLIPGAIEEILRIEPPSPVQARWVTRDVTVHDVMIPAGSRVILVTGSAGRDERKYENPDALDIRRKVDLHLTFGYRIHFCLGAALARVEGRIGLEETLTRWPEWQVDRENANLLYTSTVRGPLELPIVIA
jgi:cytochrome P450